MEPAILLAHNGGPPENWFARPTASHYLKILLDSIFGPQNFRNEIVWERSVKGGHTGPPHVRDLRGTMEREKAPIGVLVVTQKPTPEMTRDAAAAGVYHSPWDGSTYPRIQIITAGEIVHGRRVDMPSKRGTSDFTRARAASEHAEKPRLL